MMVLYISVYEMGGDSGPLNVEIAHTGLCNRNQCANELMVAGSIFLARGIDFFIGPSQSIENKR